MLESKPIESAIKCEKCNKDQVEEVSTMRVETVGNIVCAVNANIMRCKIKTCQHTFMTGPQIKEYKAKVYAEFQRKKDIKPKFSRPHPID